MRKILFVWILMAICSFSVFAELNPPENASKNSGTRGDPIVHTKDCKIELPISAAIDGYLVLGITKESLLKKLREGPANPEFFSVIKWSGECNSNGNANGNGELYVRFLDMDVLKYIGAKYMTILIDGYFNDGRMEGRVKSQLSHDYYGQGAAMIFYAFDGKYFNSERDLLEYKDPNIKKNRIAREAAQAQAQAVANQNMLANFRKSLEPGVETSEGMVLEVKNMLVKVQISQCIQRDYNDNCKQYGNAEKWFKRTDLNPR